MRCSCMIEQEVADKGGAILASEQACEEVAGSYEVVRVGETNIRKSDPEEVASRLTEAFPLPQSVS